MRRALLHVLAGLAVAAGAWAREPDAVTLAFVGDVMLADTPGRVIKAGRDPFASFAALMRRADVVIGNLECVVATRGEKDPEKPWSFRAHPRVLGPLKRHVDVVGLANNHSGDYGPAAFAEMLDRLERSGIGYFGGGRNLGAAHAPLIVERKGLRIALLGYNEFFPRWFEADHDRPGIAWSEDEQVLYDIAEARRTHRADIVIPVMHWGWEHERLASARQRRLARLMVDAGADAVVGGHPHVVQDVEIYRDKPIVYSLGNFVFDGFDRVENNTGWLLRLEIDRNGARRMQTIVARIDRQGIPHPVPATAGLCWSTGQREPSTCGTAAPDPAGAPVERAPSAR